MPVAPPESVVESTAVTQTPIPAEKPVDEWAWLYDRVEHLRPGQALTVTGANWEVYQRVMKRRDHFRQGLRIQYERGELVLMPTHVWHELWKMLIDAMIQQYCLHHRIRCSSCGMMTISKQEQDRGFEPDNCYYVQNLERILPVRAKHLDFSIDPPPDLQIEIEVNSSAENRLPLYASFGVNEVWRYDGRVLTVLVRVNETSYAPSSASLVFPSFPIKDVPRFLDRTGLDDQITILSDFIDLLRENRPPNS